MASFPEAFAALDEYRLALLSEQHNENTTTAAMAFSARCGISACGMSLGSAAARPSTATGRSKAVPPTGSALVRPTASTPSPAR